jgi:hypothetical protein
MPQDCRSCKNRGMDEVERQTRQQLMVHEALVLLYGALSYVGAGML